MGLSVFIPRETAAHEKRIAATPETVKKLAALGCSVSVESDAGLGSSITNEAFKDAGATLVKSAADGFKGADIVLAVQAPPDLKVMKKGALLIAMLAPFSNKDIVKNASAAGITAFAMELVPRISRAQNLDVLSSQSNLAGYKAVLDAADCYPRAFPMMMTAAGTVPPAKVFVMGAGVAGLQAIATAKRLGAVVSATDVRPAVKEQVESLGASFVAVMDDEFKQAETSGGYAKEMSEDYKKKQAALIEQHIAKQDIVITTALIPGRPAPKLVTKAMVESMRPGSVIVDLAVETGGNCELSKAGEIVDSKGVTLVGHLNVPSRLAADASSLYARNLLNLMNLIIDKEKKELAINWEDEIVAGVALTQDGSVIHPNFAKEKVKEDQKDPGKEKDSEGEKKTKKAKKEDASADSKSDQKKDEPAVKEKKA
ncbi:MAG: Re/Si-specific NAD(P)(+) transhydrogenase subunit alpha [Alphaproteobacteria bacterium]|nr:Re/Si-specific NAD(P)(+) transhydrogenase subunit alpha [Alphaproteobacteria bacterium]